MLNILSRYWQIFLLKQGPQDLPYSRSYLGGTLVFMVISNALVRVLLAKLAYEQYQKLAEKIKFQPLGIVEALGEMIVLSFTMFLFLYIALLFYKKTERLVQAYMAMLGVDIILSVCLALIVLSLSFPLVFTLLFIFLLYWQFVIHIHIFKATFDTTVLPAGLLALVYIIVQHNIGEALLRM